MISDAARKSSHALVLFDGVCHLCNGSVNFIIDHDRRGYFQFASQQSSAGQRLLREHHLSEEELQTIVLIENDRCYTRSDAILRIARNLDGCIRILAATVAIPRFLRDMAYDFVARHRYRWFGKMQACRMPSPEIASRFVN